MELQSLLGAHILSGADEGYTQQDSWGRIENVPSISFVLDGQVYTAVENPDDSYRSYLEGIRLGGECKNRFPDQGVIGVWEPDHSGYGVDEVVALRSAKTNAVIMLIGTANVDDYYPYCVLSFYPQCLDINQGE